jgi:transposase-like protein
MAFGAWDLAGYPNEATGVIEKPIPSGRLLIPGAVWLEGGNLKWQLSPSDKFPARDKQAPKTLLNSFVTLWKESPLTIERFAKSYGVLDGSAAEGWEPVERWQRISHLVFALLNIGAALAQNKRPAIEEWKHVGAFDDVRLKALRELPAARFQLQVEVRKLLNATSGLGFALAWNRDRRQFELEIDYGGKMLNAVAMQLALAISKSDSLFVCSGCRRPYSRIAKRPKSGQANFCPNCAANTAGRMSEALRQADARRKAKMAEARRLYREGTAPDAIAIKLNVRGGAESVQSWIEKGNWDA